MFIIRWIKRILMLIGLGTLLWWGYQYKQPESSVRKKIDEIRESGIVEEGVKDIKTWADEAYKSIKNEPEKELTKDDRDKLDKLFKEQLVDKTKNSKNSDKKTDPKKVGDKLKVKK